jgi:hypothetical protein
MRMESIGFAMCFFGVIMMLQGAYMAKQWATQNTAHGYHGGASIMTGHDNLFLMSAEAVKP